MLLCALSVSASALAINSAGHEGHDHSEDSPKPEGPLLLNNGWVTQDITSYETEAADLIEQNKDSFSLLNDCTTESNIVSVFKRKEKISLQMTCGEESVSIQYENLGPTVERCNEQGCEAAGVYHVISVTSDAVQDVARLSLENAQKLIDEDFNAKHVLKNGKKPFQGDIVVGETSFVELETGVQYIIEVSDSANPSHQRWVPTYQFKQEGAVPFLVTLPYQSQEAAEAFILKIAEQFSKPAHAH
jgi:hypothetical protein